MAQNEVSNRKGRGVETGQIALPCSYPERWNAFLAPDVPEVQQYEDILSLSTPEYLSHIHRVAQEVISSPDYLDPQTGYISQRAWKELVDQGLLASSLSERDDELRQEEIMKVGRVLSFYDTNLGLAYGITTALAIMPIQRYGSEEQKQKYLTKIKSGERMALGITDLNVSGSAALGMESNYKVNEDGTEVTLEYWKRWQGLSNGEAGLIVAATEASSEGKKMGLFLVPPEYNETTIKQTEGLEEVTYAENRSKQADGTVGPITLSAKDHLMTEIPYLRLLDFQDMFTMSRFFLVGVHLGHQERTELDLGSHVSQRDIAKEKLGEMEVPLDALNDITARRVITEAIYNRIAIFRSEGNSLLNLGRERLRLVPEANMVKSLTAEYAFNSGEQAAHLHGANSYLKGKNLGHAVNIWPFRIFEGSELMLYSDIGKKTLGKPFYEDHPTEALFDRFQAGKNLDPVTHGALVMMESYMNPVSKVHQKIRGEIMARCFALGSLVKDETKPDDFKLATSLLNLEIRNLVEELFSKE